MSRALPAILLVAALAFAVSPLLLPEFGGFDPTDYPVPQENPPVQPAGWAFAIWGPIYLWLIASAAYGLWRRADASDWQAHRAPLAVSLAIGAVWLPVAMVSPVWATILIWAMLAAALAAYLATPARDVALARAPVGLYAGWLTAASCVSLGLLAAGYGILGPRTAAWIALAAALGLGVAVWRTRPGIAYPAAIGWAAAGIWFQNGTTILGLAAALGAAAMACLAILGARRTARPA